MRFGRRSALTLAHDCAMAALAYVAALYLRLGGGLWDYDPSLLTLGLPLFVASAAAVFLAFRLDRPLWRYASLPDLLAAGRAALLANLLFVLVLFLATRLESFPRSAALINVAVLTLLLAGPRIGFRLWKDRHLQALLERDAHARVPVLLLGADDDADLFIREMSRRREAPYRVVGLLDDKASRHGHRIRGVPVLGGPGDLARAVAALEGRGERPQRLVLTARAERGAALRRLFDEADGLGLKVSRLPRLSDLEGAESTPSVRPIDVEDLLGRPQAVLDRAAMAALVAGRRVLVTGAGGTIGGELSRQIAALGPARLLLLDASEYALYRIDLEIGERHPALARSAVIADVRDAARLARLMAEAAPELVFHAAALKHVPLVEANPTEGVLTNVIGTRNVAEAAVASGVGTVVVISTDKAVNPTSVMGACKRLAEAWCQARDVGTRMAGGTRFVTVRFGNVLGSTGSVVPLFQSQLARGGPLTVTHPEVTRYFMTVREAVELVLQASALDDPRLAAGGGICVLDMGEPVRILDLARQMIRLAGLRPDRDIAITFTGLRPGEKLYEDLFHAAEPHEPTAIKGVLFARPRAADLAELSAALDRLRAIAEAGDIEGTLALLRQLVPEYQG
ncbi:MAG: nucleoside-diphosphate sugar epimerase/dehydratase [Thalassobaculales bacterium]